MLFLALPSLLSEPPAPLTLSAPGGFEDTARLASVVSPEAEHGIHPSMGR